MNPAICACCYICQQGGNKDKHLERCSGLPLYLQLKDSAYSSEPDPVTGQQILKDLIQPGSQGQLARQTFIAQGCNRRFHQCCEQRRPEAASDHKYFDQCHLTNEDTVHTIRDLRHRLCSICLKEVQDSLTTKYTGEYSGMCQSLCPNSV